MLPFAFGDDLGGLAEALGTGGCLLGELDPW